MKKLSKRLLSVLLVIAMLVPTGALMIQSTATDNTYKVGDVVTLGIYPQTKVTDSNLISSLNAISATWMSYGYMSGAGTGWCDGSAKESDYMKYKDVTYKNERYRAIVFSTYRPGLTTHKSTETCYNFQKSNGYIINNIYWFKFEPLKWKILDVNEGLILCDSIIDSQSFNDNLYSTGNTSSWSGRYWKDANRTIFANDYTNSGIKNWLNDDFYYTAFSESNRKAINTQTNGNIFLLTTNNINNSSYGFINDDSRKGYGTDYAKAQGLRVVDGTSIWMTQTAASSLGINISCVHFDGHIFGRESNDYGHAQMTFHGIRPAMYVDLNELSKMQKTEHFPDGYDFNEDSYCFENYRIGISQKYFTTMYGSMQGKLLHSVKNKAGTNGVCFGMAYTTAAFFNEQPGINNVYWDRLPEGSIVDYQSFDCLRDVLSKNALVDIGNVTISIDDYIKYAYIFQYSSENLIYEFDDIFAVKDKVLSATTNNELGVCVLLSHDTDGGHAVLAVGVDGNDILIDDPNESGELERITVNSDGSWSFSNPWTSKGVNSSNTTIHLSYDYATPYNLIATGTNTTVVNGIIVYAPSGGTEEITERYVFGMNKLDSDKLLAYVDSESYELSSTNISEVKETIGTVSETQETGDLYWVSEDKSITVSDITGEDNEIIIAGNEVSIGVKTKDESIVTMTVNEENDDVSAEINSTEGNEYTITFESIDENENNLITTITGTANGNKVTATETDKGIQVTGLNDISVTYETADGTGKTRANIDDGSTVNITVDDPSNTVTTDWNCKHEDTDHDGVCDVCSEDFTKNCSHLCHNDNAFVQFIWKIINFLYRIFGTNQYCDCGNAHW